MLDFTSSLYLGFTHPSCRLPPWRQLTAGRPAALHEPALARRVAARLAALVGCEAAMLAPSTLHAAWDLFGTTVFRDWAVFLDAHAYPVLRWGIERAATLRTHVYTFPHHDPSALLAVVGRQDRRPLVVCDGLLPASSGGLAPLREYLDVARRYGGALLLDDTQALGVLGSCPGADAPYGRGGGGSLRHCGVTGADVVVVASLAKAFGVPVAAVAASGERVRRLSAESDVRVHCSPVSIGMLNATAHALALNAARGEALRDELAQRVMRFRSGLARYGVAARGGLFPVQALPAFSGESAVALHAALLSRGVRALLHKQRRSGRAQVSFVLTTRHASEDVDRAVKAVVDATRELTPAGGVMSTWPVEP